MYRKNKIKAIVALAVALAFVMPGAAAFANVGTIDVTTNLENTDTINNIVEDGEGPIDKREVPSDTSDVVEDAVLGSGGNIIYVGSGPDNDSTTIQGGINLAEPGDTVYVYSGTYNECVTVGKSLNLIGESKEDTIIIDDGGGKVVDVSADAFISDFTIKNGATVGIWITNRCNITNCICYDNKYGIAIFSASEIVHYVNITSCTCSNNTNTGLYLNGQYCTIKNCTFSNNPDYGLKLVGNTGYNKIYHNNFMNNGQNTVTKGGGWYQIWDNGYPSGGNYWDTYTGVDEHHGPDQDIPGSDGIGDTAYEPPEEIANPDGNDWDYYPLMHPWGTPPEVTNVTATLESQSVYSMIDIYNYFIGAENWRDCGNESDTYQFEITSEIPYGIVNITCTVEDVHNGVKPAIVYITDPSGYQQGFEMTGIDVDYLGNGEYYYNYTTDTEPPVISDVILTNSIPIDTEPGFGWEKVTCTVTDNAEVDTVQLNITYPDLHTGVIPMTETGVDVYSCETTLTDIGDYTYHIWADDTNDNSAESTPEEEFILPPNYETDMDYGTRTIDFWDLVEVVKYYGQTGDNGWIREDVDNNGAIDFWDLVEVVKHYGESW